MPRVRTGLNEFERMQRERAAAEEARQYVKELAGLKQDPEDIIGQLFGGQKPKKLTGSQKAALEHTRGVSQTRGELGAYVGGTSKDAVGNIKKVSSYVKRDKITGLRMSGNQEGSYQLGPEYKLEGKTLTPSQQAQVKMSGFNDVYGAKENLALARRTGREAAKVRRQLSQSVINMIEGSGLDASQKANAYKLAGGSVMRRDLPKALRPEPLLRGSRNQSEPVNPSVDRRMIQRVQGMRTSPFEPITGKPDIPSVFKNAFKGFLGIGTAATVASKGATVAHAANMFPSGEVAKLDTLTAIGNAMTSGNRAKAMEIAHLASLKNPNLTPRQKQTIIRRYNRNIGIKPQAVRRSVRAK